MPRRTTKKQQTQPRTNRSKVGFTADELERVDALRKSTGFKTRSGYIRARALGYRPPHNVATRYNDGALLLLHRIARQLTGATTNLNQIAKRANAMRRVEHQDLLAVEAAVERIAAQKDYVIRAAQHIVDMAAHDEDGGEA